MDVAPHPHIGLQTVSWLLDGEIVHTDSLGCEAVARPGAVNVMRSGRGIAHAERTPIPNRGRLEGVQLWVALPDQHRGVPACFQHVSDVPAVELRGGIVQPFSGSLAGTTSLARHHTSSSRPTSRSTAATLSTSASGRVTSTASSCSAAIARSMVSSSRTVELYYLGTQRSAVGLASRGGARLLLVGGPPFPEPILMWWNFVARTPVEIADARTDWAAHRRFGGVAGYPGPRLAAPALTRFARPNPIS